MKATTTVMILTAKLFDATQIEQKSPPAPLNCILVDAEARCVIACDGRILVRHDIPGDAPVKPGFITPTIWKQAKATAKAIILDYAAGTLNGIPLAPADEMNYVNWQAVVPTHDTAYRIAITPSLLVRAAAALGAGTDAQPFVTLEFDTTGEAPVRLIAGNASGILMPVNGKGDAGLQAKQSECSDSNTAAADAKVIAALTASLHEAKARVTQLQAHALLHNGRGGTLPPAVKPLDAKPTGKATSPDPKASAEKAPVQPATAPPDLTRNELRDGIELRFNGKPSDEIRQQFKDRKWKWAPGQPGQPWYAKYSEENWLFANALAYGTAYTAMPELPENIVDMPGTTPDAPVTPPRIRKIQAPKF